MMAAELACGEGRSRVASHEREAWRGQCVTSEERVAEEGLKMSESNKRMHATAQRKILVNVARGGA